MPGNDTFGSHSLIYIFIVFTPINYFYDAKKNKNNFYDYLYDELYNFCEVKVGAVDLKLIGGGEMGG